MINTNSSELTLFSKTIIITIDLILWRFIWFFIAEFIGVGVSSEIGSNYSHILNTLSYLLYFVFPEIYFKRTLGMVILRAKINIVKPKKLKNYLVYIFLSYFDRTVLFIFYIVRGLWSVEKGKLLLSEKVSGFYWVKNG